MERADCVFEASLLLSDLNCVKPGSLQVIVSYWTDIVVLCQIYVDCAYSWFPGLTLLLTSQLVRSKLGSSAMDRCLIVVLFVFPYTAKLVKKRTES